MEKVGGKVQTAAEVVPVQDGLIHQQRVGVWRGGEVCHHRPIGRAPGLKGASWRGCLPAGNVKHGVYSDLQFAFQRKRSGLNAS